MKHHLYRLANTLAYGGLLAFTFCCIAGAVHSTLALVAFSLSALWLGLTVIEIRSTLSTYLYASSRLRFVLGLTIGSCSAFLTALLSTDVVITVIAIAELLSWSVVLRIFLRNRSHYKRLGHGPLPANIAVNPPADKIIPGDLILTGGFNGKGVARTAHEADGHGEFVLLAPDGSKQAFTSLAGTGALVHPLTDLTVDKKRGNYIVLRLVNQLDAAQVVESWQITQRMLTLNALYRTRTRAKVLGLAKRLPLKAESQSKLDARIERFISGYDWVGLLNGKLKSDHWTCIGACLEAYRILGVHTLVRGGYFNAIMPVVSLEDTHFRALTVNEVNA